MAFQDDSLAYALLIQKSSQELTADHSDLGDASTADHDNSSATDPDSSSIAALDSSSATSVEATSPSFVPAKSAVVFLRQVSVHDPRADPIIADLICQTRLLSETVFGEDCLQEITKKTGWKLTLLASEDRSVLCGFLVWKILKGSLSIAKLAVPSEFRGSGFGRLIMEDAIKAAKKQGDVFEVCLSSLPNAVTFYQRLHFKAFTSMKIDTDKDLVEGQVYMEKKLRNRPRHAKR